jgi:hypothetical protein
LNKKKDCQEKRTKIATIIVTNMKYVINIKRKPSIIKKEGEEEKKEHIYNIWKIFSSTFYIVVSVERHINIRNENL